MTPEQVARHEAAHAVMCVLLGVPVRYISTIPDGSCYGHVMATPNHAAEWAVILLAALIEDDALPTWPINYPTTGDEADLMELIEVHGITERQYMSLVIAALRLTSSTDYQRLMTATTGLLDYTPTIDRDLLERVVTIAEQD